MHEFEIRQALLFRENVLVIFLGEQFSTSYTWDCVRKDIYVQYKQSLQISHSKMSFKIQFYIYIYQFHFAK